MPLFTARDCSAASGRNTPEQVAGLPRNKWPEWSEYATGSDDDKGAWEQQGDEPELLMQEIVDCRYELAEALVDVLGEDEWHLVRDGGDPFYDSSSSYVYAPEARHEHHEVWNEFQARVKFERRYLDREIEAALAELFTDFPEEWTKRPDGPVQEISPGDITIFRARAGLNEDEVRKIVGDPDRELGPPPKHERSAGRLNAAGIGVFYGGLSSDVSVAEMRPPLGTYVVVGEFEVIRPFKVFDLTAFDRHPPSGSLFRPGYGDERRRWGFLQSFHWEVTQPVRPGAEPLEYVPTQVIAEYLHTQLEFDGVIYRSAQVGVVDLADEELLTTPSELRNIALFGTNRLVDDGQEIEGEHQSLDDLGTFLGEPTLDQSLRRKPLLRRCGRRPDVRMVREIRYRTSREFLSMKTGPIHRSSEDGDE